MSGERGKHLLKRHSLGAEPHSDILSLHRRVMDGIRHAGSANEDEALLNDVAGDRRGTSVHKATTRKGGGQ